MSTYKTLHEFGMDEIIIEKSTFIGYAKPIKTEEEAIEFVNEIKKKHKDATHNVWAYTVGKTMNIQRYSDDGEPQGTAGIPTLEVIKKEDLRDVVVVVTRYFGGVKLGAGGLVRAYTKGAKIGIDAAKVIEKVMYKEVRIKIDYNQLGKVQNEIMNMGYKIKDTLYTDKVEIIVYSREEEAESLKSKMIDITSGTAEIGESEGFYLSEKEGEIIAPIARDEESIITRKVAKGGKYAHTSYQVVQSFGDIHLVDIQLHTGRTHQIRVHFSHIGFPLLGDDLYGGSLEDGIERQALHCHRLSYYHPFLEEELVIESPLPPDFQAVLTQLQTSY